MATATLSRTLSPLRIGPVEVPNRVARTGHVTLFSPMGPVNDALIDYHLARAKGGVGLTILEALAVHPTSGLSLAAWAEGLVDGYRRLMAAVRPHGMKIFQQLWHGGHIYPQPTGAPPWAPSAIPHYVTGMRPIATSKAQIQELVDAFVAAAQACAEGGLDGVEVHAGHGYLIAQFLSPLLNQRTDEYGGSLDNRMRFLLEILRGIRAAIPATMVLGIRVSESSDAGVLSMEETKEIARRLEAEGLIDYLNISHGDYYHIIDQIGSMTEPAGYQLATSGDIASAVRVPRLVTGRFRTLEEIEQVLREGTADLVSMVRAHIADADIVRKTIDHGADRVRPCLACNQGCIAGAIVSGRVGCVVNPAVGYEGTLSEDLIGTTDAAKTVLVVGGGPGGMEAARAAALRGHKVILAEAAPRLGGALDYIRNAPSLQTMGDYRIWIESEIFRLGVEVRTSTYMDAGDVRAEKPDVVILATGASPDLSGFQVAMPSQPMIADPGARVISSIDLLSDQRNDWGSRAVVYDDTGDYEAIACAEYLIARGVHVTFVSRQAMFGQIMEATARAEPALDRLGKDGLLRVILRARIVEAKPGEAVIVAHGSPQETVPAETVVFVGYKVPNDDLAAALADDGIPVHRIGDALSGRDLQTAIREGHLAGRAIL
jgi:2,4-dienoyl-CoA reductase-like NADH-dependent reductase (Old Yellow Enzyme family)/thioredoxin reductase